MDLKTMKTITCAGCGKKVDVNYPYEFKDKHQDCPVKNTPVTDRKCPKCQGDMVYKLGKYQVFRSCAKWPTCDGKIAAPRGQHVPKVTEIPDITSPEIIKTTKPDTQTPKYRVGDVVTYLDGQRTIVEVVHNNECPDGHIQSNDGKTYHYHHVTIGESALAAFPFVTTFEEASVLYSRLNMKFKVGDRVKWADQEWNITKICLNSHCRENKPFYDCEYHYHNDHNIWGNWWVDTTRFEQEAALIDQVEQKETKEMPKQQQEKAPTNAQEAIWNLVKDAVAKQDQNTASQVIQTVSKELNSIRTELSDLIKKSTDNTKPLTIEIKQENKPVITVDNTHGHTQLSRLLKLYSAGFRNFLLVGPAGSGKSTLGETFAQALHRQFAVISVTAGISESRFISRMTPNFTTGEESFRPTDFLNAYVNGGVYMIDEVDRGDANTMIVFNAALANGHLPIPSPDWPVAVRDPETVLIFTANTYGTGPDRQYVGANQLDAAFLNRFVGAVLEVDYDRELEKRLCDNSEILSVCWTIRKNVQSNKLRRIWGTREILAIQKLQSVGESLRDAVKACMTGWTADEVSKCTNGVW